nr:folylpolyglutamate synthase/dihydrofolate synthase family protein [uncultured Muribaculum sp.]
MTYEQALDFLYTQLPMYQRQGAPAYKPGLDTSRRLAAAFGNPHRRFRSIHVGGTNGKGSTAHTLAAMLQSAGYRTGLYTSPHLVDFRERIRVDGEMIGKDAVADFVERYLALPEDVRSLHPSFFELTMVMAFDYMARRDVDVAVVEVGMGGRLDSTNIISPDLCVITNISLDHTQFLGSTLPEIAAEKAGIIKPDVPVVVGEAEGDVRRMFAEKAASVGAPVMFACDAPAYSSAEITHDGIIYRDTPYGTLRGQLTGDCQPRNAATILAAVGKLIERGYNVGSADVARGMAHVCDDTGLMGRWMVVGDGPRIVCDTGHNVGGWQYLAPRLAALPGIKHMVIGFVSDKDVAHILEMMPKSGVRFYFTRASIDRAMDSTRLRGIAADFGLRGDAYPTVAEAVEAACGNAAPGDTVFVGGSTFVVADFLATFPHEK